ncbi:MAG: phosphoadenosine phosphosulfate reductase family protein [Crenarchaeota archaeon]|nr:phosphoadenosine phosphosulfate reductase family protein [Thermoproteota archaeon]
MVELIELDRRWLGICGDVLLIASRERAGFYIATSRGVYRLRPQVLSASGVSFDPMKWFEPGPLANFSIFSSLDEAVDYVAGIIGDKIRGKRIAVSFSGGKDSVALTAVLKEVCDRVGCEIYVIYIHMPFIEPRRFAEEAMRIGKKLGVDVVYGEPPRRLVKMYLVREGLPYRRARWCTYLKTRKLKNIAVNELGCDYIAVGDRIWENLKRFSRLAPVVIRRKLSVKKLLYPIAPATLCDVVNMATSLSAIHVAYREGCIRVSCLLCPYKSIVELSSYSIDKELEDPGLVYSVLKMEWRRWYSDRGIEYSEFAEEALWRFVPSVAKLFLNVKKAVGREDSEYSCEDIRRGIAMFMTARRRCTRVSIDKVEQIAKVLEALPDVPYIDIPRVASANEDRKVEGC